jgi:predicted nucleic acid-binding protein
MTSVVLDASAALAWMLRSQATSAATAFLRDADAWTFEVPAIFSWEVFNVLVTLERRGSLSKTAYDEALAIYGRLDLRTNGAVIDMDNLVALARRTGLSLFDAAYLALALDQEWALASRDEALLAVAAKTGLRCFDLRSVT